ncbi:MAG: antibiotic efflux protein [Modestobacter sp.]|nr:antibiotic efflux protein [Modestobacter sp.]
MTSSRGLGRRYWRLWSAGAVDSVGDGAWTAALPLLALSLSADPRTVSTVAAAGSLPWLLVSLPVGVMVDRRSRIALIQRAQLAQLAVMGALTVAVLVGVVSAWSVVAGAFLLGCCQVVVDTAAQSALPALVPADLLARANGNQYAAQVTGEAFLGPPVGSLSFAVAPALPFGINTVSFAVSALLLGRPSQWAPLEASTGPVVRVPLRSAIGEGLRWLAGSRVLRTLALLLGVNSFCNQLGQATLVLFVVRTLGVDPAGYGLVLAAGAVGSVLGAVVGPLVSRRAGTRVAVLAALAVSAAAYLAAGAVHDATQLAVLLAVNGLAIMVWNIETVTLRQQLVPAGLLGRVNSVYRLLGWGLLPIGAVAGGLVAHGLGLRAPLPLAGALRALALIAAAPVLFRALRRPGPP